MNKYQEDYEFLREIEDTDIIPDGDKGRYNQALKNYKELVDKATPKKLETRGKFPTCTICNKLAHSIMQNYCTCCGQKLDWGE